MLKSQLLATLLITAAATHACAVGPSPSASPAVKPRAVLKVQLILDDGSVIQSQSAVLKDGVIGRLNAKHAGSDSQLNLQADDSSQLNGSSPTTLLAPATTPAPSTTWAPSTPAPALAPVPMHAPEASNLQPEGFWVLKPVTCPHGRILGYKRVWVSVR